MSSQKHSRRQIIKAGVAGIVAAGAGERLAASGALKIGDPPGPASAASDRPFLTPAGKFGDVSRGSPIPHTLRGQALVDARLTPDTWRLEVIADPSSKVKRTLTIKDGTALDLPGLHKLGEKHAVKFLKAMQCLNINQPLGQGLWEGVPLREILRLMGRLTNVRRVFYSGFHNNDPKQLFRSSLSYTQVMETPPGELPAFLAYRLNGQPLPLERGGPVRMLVPWSHGFKSIKWIQEIVVTNDYKANDTYAESNNDPESHLKTAAYLDDFGKQFPAGKPVMVRGTAITGMSGLKRVEYWVRPDEGPPDDLADDDPAWEKAKWLPCRLEGAPRDWSMVLPAAVSARELLGFDPDTGRPREWPMRYSIIGWSAAIEGLAAGKYEVRARAVDLNDFAQPEPRPYLKSGRNPIMVRRFEVK